MTNFLPRLITGILYISFVAGSILFNSRSFTLVFSLLMLIALYESNELWKKIRLKNSEYNYPIPQAYVGLSMITLILVPFFFSNTYNPFPILLIFILLLFKISFLFNKLSLDKFLLSGLSSFSLAYVVSKSMISLSIMEPLSTLSRHCKN